MLRMGMFAALLSAALTLANAASAQTVSFDFFQSGYDDGAFVSGTFAGEDLNTNGRLEWNPTPGLNELTAFSLSFSGNSLVGAFSLGLGDVMGLLYGLDGGPLGDLAPLGNEGILAGISSSALLLATGSAGYPGCGSGALCGQITSGQFVTETNELVQISVSVPEPGGLAVVVVGLMLVAVEVRRNRRRGLDT